MLQVTLFVILVVYLLDLINARDGLCVAVWVGALIITMFSGFMTLLEIDDADATGRTMILYLSRLSVEGMHFCTWVSVIWHFCFCILIMYLTEFSLTIGMLDDTAMLMDIQRLNIAGRGIGAIVTLPASACLVGNIVVPNTPASHGLLGNG